MAGQKKSRPPTCNDLFYRSAKLMLLVAREALIELHPSLVLVWSRQSMVNDPMGKVGLRLKGPESLVVSLDVT